MYAARLLSLVLLLTPIAAIADFEEHEENHKNEIGIFVGITHERRENGAALGLEYGRHVTDRFGIGLVAERTWGDFDFWVFAVPLAYSVDDWVFAVAPGVERGEEDTEELVRLTVGYEIETESTLIVPSLSVDFVDGEQVYVLGASFAFGF
ncbi:MAG: hypothetical protein QNJ00_05590 [Woeseiaceae bacterium]|nr:hypothetical protein [Woeseiaceae bacterium]